jgi:hypothetical protein
MNRRRACSASLDDVLAGPLMNRNLGTATRLVRALADEVKRILRRLASAEVASGKFAALFSYDPPSWRLAPARKSAQIISRQYPLDLSVPSIRPAVSRAFSTTAN